MENVTATPELVAQLVSALEATQRIGLLHDSIAENYARIRGAGRTTTAESAILARQNIEDARAALRAIREQTNGALDAARKAV